MDRAEKGGTGTESDSDGGCFKTLLDTHPDGVVDIDYRMTWTLDGGHDG